MESLALTTTELRMWFKEFNAEYFDNKLSMPTLQIKKCKSLSWYMLSITKNHYNQQLL